MLTKKIQELNETKAKVSNLEGFIAKLMHKELATLHTRYGFSTGYEFVRALNLTYKGEKTKESAFGGSRAIPRRRAKVNDEIRERVKSMAASGVTGSQIAKTLAISLATVQNIKKSLGITRASKKVSAV